MSIALELLMAAVLVLGGLFGLIGSLGLLRLKDPLQRLHAPTKATTIGVGAALIASDVEFFVSQGRIAWEEGAVAVFLFLTAPLSALMLAKLHLWSRSREGDVPPPEGGGTWAIWSRQETAGDAAARD